MPPRKPPACGRTFDDEECTQRGDHLCAPRIHHVQAFFGEILVHTKGRWSRTAFHLLDWQVTEIMEPLFASVTWSSEFGRYVRRYRLAWVEVARKNGKALDVDTPILAGRGWTTMGDLQPGDTVHAADGTLTRVEWISERHRRPSYRVEFADGARIVAADDHKWLVNDRRHGGSRIATTEEIAETVTGGADLLRYSVDVPPPVVRPDVPPVKRSSSPTNAVVNVQPVGERQVVCISVEHHSHVFLAGNLLTPTHNSELLAGIALYLLIADDEDGSEVYGCAVDRDQARKVYDVAERMVHLSPILTARLKINKQAKRIYDVTSGSYYEVVAADAAGNLGHNPHGIVFDEVLTQKNSDLWNAMRTGMGAREQPLMVAATTAGDDPQSFGKAEHDEMQKIADDPERSRHIFVYMRNLPADADPWDETLWPLANPALGQFLSIQSLRDEAQEARNDPAKENAFRQYRLNQWVSQASRWMPMHLWDSCTGDLWLNPHWHNNQLDGKTAYAGFDLAAKFDLTAWAIVVPGDEPKEDPAHIMWRFWLPESGLDRLDKLHDGKFTRWARQGWLTITDGSVIDYDKVIDDIAEDAKTFRIVAADCDEWSMWPIINRIGEALNLDVEQGELTAYRNTYDRMSPGMTDLMGTVKRGLLRHHGNPVARFCFDQCEVRHAPYDPNLIRPEKPERARDKARIDAVPAAAMAVNAWKSREGMELYQSAYEDNKLMVI